MRDEQETPSILRRPLTGRVVIATHNSGKLAEMRELLAPFRIETISAGDVGLDEPEETGTSFGENARIKARAAALASALPAFADDSGLVVEALGGAPGIHSARWAGPDRNFSRAMTEIEDKLRAARGDKGFGYDPIFLPDGYTRTFGEMTSEEKHGLPPTRNQAEWSPVSRRDRAPNEKVGTRPDAKPDASFADRVPLGLGLSHRARAFRKLAEACLEQ